MKERKNMNGIDFNLPILYKHASLRFFEKDEHHVTRFCRDNVLLLVYDGILRFSEDGEECEVSAGEYYIQRKNCYQRGIIASDAPQYLYVHFDAEWTDSPDALSYHGRFDLDALFELMQRIDTASHQKHSYNEQQYLFLKLLLKLKSRSKKDSLAKRISEYVEENIETISSLSDICDEFHYSKNYIIRVFNKEFGISPIQYINEIKLKRAMYLLEATSKPITEIADECGFADYPYFYKRFVQKTGISPLKWRKQIQENPSPKLS
jgi:AraC-like DNA-binding protein